MALPKRSGPHDTTAYPEQQRSYLIAYDVAVLQSAYCISDSLRDAFNCENSGIGASSASART
jgi:hypothetical protein